MAETVIFVAKIALTAYSAVSAVKALSDGNIMGAIMGGFGAYMGAANLGVFNTAVAGDALAQTAAIEAGGSQQAAMLAEQTADFGAFGAGETAEALGSFDGGLLSDSATNIMSSYDKNIMSDLGSSGAGEIGAKLDLGSGGFLESAKGVGEGWIDAIKQQVAKIDLGGNLVSTKDGSLLAKAGEAFGGTGELMKMGGMALDYLGKEKAIDAQTKAAEEGFARTQAEAARSRASIGAAPDYVYGFGTRKEQV